MTSQDWLDEIADRPLTDLVEGLELVSSQSIPYAHLPRRLSIYSTELVRWSDVSAETPLTLMARPKIGESAVRALVQAAVEAVAVHRAVEARAGDPAAAVEALVARLDDYDRVVLATRVWPRSPNPRAAFVAAERLGVSDTSVRRNQARAAARFAELLGESVHQDVRDLAEDLHRRFGPYVPIDVVDAVLTDLGVDPVSQVAEVLLYVAGPYRVDGMWAEDISASGRQGVSAVVDELFASCPAPTVEAVRSTLIGVGMPAEVVEVYQREHLRLRRFGDVCVRWEGSNVADLIEAVLHGRGVGLTVEDLYEQLGADRVSTQRIAAVLSADERFVRASRRRWKLRSWGGGQYSSIADAISERIVAHGGRARVSEIVSEVLERFPDVTEKSVRSYLYSLAFVHDQGWVRRRKRSDLFPDAGPLNAVRGTFRSGLDEVRVVVAVDEELLRGSGSGCIRRRRTRSVCGQGSARASPAITGNRRGVEAVYDPRSCGELATVARPRSGSSAG